MSKSQHLDAAFRLADNGYPVFPVIGKWPAIRGWQDAATNDRQRLRRLFYRADLDVGMKTGEVVVIDFDLKALGFSWIEAHRSVVTVAVETFRGVHCWFRAEEPVATMKIDGGDLKASGGLVVCPDSFVKGWQYRYLPGHDLVPIHRLVPFDLSYIKPLMQHQRPITREKVRDVTRYVMKIESIQGQHGSHGLVRACAICRDAGLSESDAMLILLRWNEQAEGVSPPWPPEDIARACHRVYTRSTRQ